MPRVRLRALLLGSVFGLSLAPTAAFASAPKFSEKTVRRFLASYGYAGAVKGDHVQLASGATVPIADITTPSALFELTHKLERPSFRGLLGLRSDQGATKIWLENLGRADDRLVGRSEPARSTVEAHDRAVSALVHGAGVPGAGALADRLSTVASHYVALSSPAIAQQLQRKLQRVHGAERKALLLGAQIADARDERDKMDAKLEQLEATPGSSAEELRRAARIASAIDPRLGLRLARKAFALAPEDPSMISALGYTALIAGRYNEYTDATGKKGSRQDGIDEGMALLARAAAAGAPVEHLAISPQVLPKRGRDTRTLARAVAHYEHGRLDEAERVAKEALAQEPNEGLAHHLISLVRGARLRQAEEVLMRGEKRALVVESKVEAHRLAGAAKREKIETLVPEFGRLSLARQATIARGLLPWRAHWPEMQRKGSVIHLVGLAMALPEAKDSTLTFTEQTMDGRYWYGVRGLANSDVHRALVGVERLDRVYKRSGRDTLSHEFAHLVHYTLPKPQRAELDQLFKRALAEGRIIDPYSRNNVWEYFARGYEIWLSHQGDVVGAKVKPEPPELLRRDRALYDFITRETERGRTDT